MKFKTGISKMKDDDMVIRGKKHAAMIASWSFAKTTFFLLSGKEPDKKEERLFQAMLTAIIDHGMGTASAMTSRMVMSTGNPLNAAVAGGVLALGDYHGGAIEKAMRMLQEVKESEKSPEEYVKESLEIKRLLYGFGHKVYKEADPRTKHLLEMCKEMQFTSEHIDAAVAIEKAIEEQKGKKLVLNIDGAIAALLLALGFPPEAGKGIFIIGRTPGLVAQAMEEQARERPVRRVSEEEIIYDGPEDAS